MTSVRFDVAIVGTGHAGAQAAIALRQGGFDGSLALIGEEADLPYERPPLSKDYLSGTKTLSQIMLRPTTFWAERKIVTLLGRRVMQVEPGAHTLLLSDQTTVEYGVLIWAGGGHPRKLTCSGEALSGVHYVRTRADVDAILSRLSTIERAVVVGGGYIGLEAAASLRKLGKEVVVLEALERVLARVAGRELSTFFEQEHRTHGVDLRTGVAVEGILGQDGHVTGVQIAGGEMLSCDTVIVGIGIIPAVEPLRVAGATGATGVLVDQHCRTSLPDIFAIGDCAAHVNRFADGATIRLESVQNATDQALVVARTILGQPAPYDSLPWFWSNQFDLRLQTVGISAGHDSTVLRGDVKSRSFSIVYLKCGRVIALDCVNATRDYVQGRKLILDRAAPSIARLADGNVPLKELSIQ
jgi:3-phenylpropionate/trans-cinnamate dioxygenase ferredoxin reductase subunit